MDRHGLLTVARRLDQACRIRNITRAAQSQIWNWNCTAVIFPEAPCVFCHDIMRSPGIWLLQGERQKVLLGAIFPKADAKLVLHQPKHAHMLTSVNLCLGTHDTGVALLGAMVNLSGVSMFKVYVPRWYKRYWNHDCLQMREFIVRECTINENPSGAISLIRELDTPWSM